MWFNILGWGQTSKSSDTSFHLRQGAVRTKSKRRYLEIYPYIDTRESFCAGSRKSDVCFGDSGGAVLDRHARIRGVISRGARCGDPRYPGVYSRLDSAKGWIRKTLRKKPKRTFPAPGKEIKYNPFNDFPYSMVWRADSDSWILSFDVYSREKVSEASVIFPAGTAFCPLTTGECNQRVYPMEDLRDPNQTALFLSGYIAKECISFFWRVNFLDKRLGSKKGKRSVCSSG